MPKRIRVEGMNITTTPAALRAAFAEFGPIVHHAVELDPSSAAVAVGYIEFATAEAGDLAIERMHNTTVDGAAITVRADP